MKSSFKDLTGLRFGRLRVKSFSRKKEKNGSRKYYFLCECDCGKVKEVEGYSLRSGKIVSCGCYGKEKRASARPKISTLNMRLYAIYNNMKHRCYDKKCNRYKNYGARGVSMCPNWLGRNGSKNFCEWALHSGYKDSLTIDRIDVNGDYCPENCRWATKKEQSRNTTKSRILTYKGVSKTIADWSDDTGIGYATLYQRMLYGWSSPRIIETPVKNHKEYERATA